MYNILTPNDTSYSVEFWNALKRNGAFEPNNRKAKAGFTNAYVLPTADNAKYKEELRKENFFRVYGTVIPMYENNTTVRTVTDEASAEWIPEGGVLPEDDGILDTFKFDSYKLGSIAKLHLNLLEDSGFDFESWVLKSFAHRFGRAETKAFINGTGNNEPLGILADEGGAEVGVTTADVTITYNEVIALFHSLEPKFRENAVWVMNDATALTLRTLKDNQGNYLWPAFTDKLLGKKVVINNEMPHIGAGTKPIAFGNFSYYWIMERVPFGVRVLNEKYITQQLRGYVGYEHLDAKLIRPDAIRVIKMAI